MSWGSFNIRTHVKDALKELKEELGKSSYSDVIEYLVGFYRNRRGEG